MPPVRETAEKFLDLVCADEDLLRAEFDSLIDACWDDPPTPVRPPVRPAPRTGPPAGRPVRRRSPTVGRPAPPGDPSPARQRSPPNLTKIDSTMEGR